MEAIILVPENNLMIASPEEGRLLAIKMARLIIRRRSPPDAQIRENLRAVYTNDAMMLLAVGHTMAIEFSTIAAASDYWRGTR